MNLAPIYELKSRLRAAAIAGTNLLSEDFRLKKAVEGFAPLAKASPVFAKINEMTNNLLSDNSPANLLDTITLVDSVITTLGTLDVKSDISDLETLGGGEILNAPYSRLSAIIDALTTKGSGNYNTFKDVAENSPELLRDYRVRPALVTGMGASYSELADDVTEAVEGMDSSMIPLLKMGFDPKGKKEMVRRIQVIETLGGASENAFYLEQLESSEKDVRKALIYALCHDVSNADKLIELTKTEKGKMKTAAMSALITLDCEKSAAFFEEYSKKKPVEVLELMENVSSKWASELTVRLIDMVLVDKSGNKITLAKMGENKAEQKYNISASDIIAALSGKFGSEIEKIYREYDNREKDTDLLSSALGKTIIKTGDENLRKLAIELNNDSKMRGCYVYAEAVARLLGDEDCSEWFEEQVKKVYSAPHKIRDVIHDDRTNSPIYRVANLICFGEGEYRLAFRQVDYADGEKYISFRSKPINQPIKGAFTDIFIKYPTVGSTTTIVYRWVDINDKEYCEKIKNLLIEQSTTASETGTRYFLSQFKKVNAKNIKGLAMMHLRNHPKDNFWDLRGVFNVLCGDDEYKLAEAREVYEALKNGKLKLDVKENEIEEFIGWAEKEYG